MATEPRTNPDLTPEQQARLDSVRRKATKDRKLGVDGPPPDVDWSDGTPYYFALRTFVGQLRKAREEAGLTLTAVAEKSGLAPETLSRLETGALTNPTFQTLAKYAVAVGRKVVLTAG